MPEGLRIICRRDGVFKLLNGEKVAAPPIEEALTLSSSRIQHAVAVGEGRDFVAVLVFPDPALLAALDRGEVPPAALRREIGEALRPQLSTYAEVRAAAVVPRELSVADGELTPTLKVVRTRVAERCAEWVDALYRPDRHPRLQRYILRLGGGRTPHGAD
jgi:long-chain acyl-CoA synthetase